LNVCGEPRHPDSGDAAPGGRARPVPRSVRRSGPGRDERRRGRRRIVGRAEVLDPVTGRGITRAAQDWGTQGGDLRLEVAEAVEAAVDRGEAQVGDLVELAKRAEHGQPDLVR